MPISTWSWSSGAYSGSFSFNQMYIYSNYLFTGYSTIWIDVTAKRNKPTPAGNAYTVYLMTGSGQGQIATSQNLNSTSARTVKFYNMSAGKKYGVVFGKAKDGATLNGTFKVRNK